MNSHTTADMIDESNMMQVDQFLQDAQEIKTERDQRHEFQGNDDHVALASLDAESFIQFCKFDVIT